MAKPVIYWPNFSTWRRRRLMNQ